MSRLLDAQPAAARAAVAAVLNGHPNFIYLAHFDFASQAMGFSNWNIPYTDSSGFSWIGGGDLVRVSGLRGGTGEQTHFVKYELGIPKELWDGLDQDQANRIPALLHDQGDYLDRYATFQMQLFDEGFQNPVGVPIVEHRGKMAKPSLSVSRSGIVFSIYSESVLSGDRIPPFSNYTNADQQRRFPTDNGLAAVPTAASRPVDWVNSNA